MPRYQRLCFVCSKPQCPAEFIGLHRVPQSKGNKEKWMEVLKLQPYDKIDSVRVCSRHFLPKDFGTLVNTTYRLLSSAYPTQFMRNKKVRKRTKITTVEPPELPGLSEDINNAPVMEIHAPEASLKLTTPDLIEISEEINNTPVIEIHTTEVSPVLEESLPSTPTRRCFEPRYVSEIRTSDFDTPNRANRVVEMIKKQNSLQSKKIQSLQKDVRMLMQKISSLEKTIEHLKENRMIVYTNKI